MIKNPTLWETLNFIGESDRDISDTIYDFYTNMGISKDVKEDEEITKENAYDHWCNLVAKHLVVDKIINDYAVCVKLTDYIWARREVFEKFMNEENREGYRPMDYDPEDINPEIDGVFYDVYLTTFECLVIGNYAESDYLKLYKMLLQWENSHGTIEPTAAQEDK